jgi:hypothetical protein
VERYHPERAAAYRLVVFQKLHDWEHVRLAESLKARGARVVLDLCDHPFYHPGEKPRYEEEARSLREMLPLVDRVTVPSEALARELSCGAVVVPDGITPPSWRSRWWRALAPRARDGSVELAWYGIHGSGRAPSGMRDLLRIADLLEELAGEFPLRLNVVSNSRGAYEKLIRPLPFRTRYLEWGSYDRFCGLFPAFDVCVIPVNPNPYTLCKSNNRLALSLYLGVPVVADSIPSYEEFSPFCVLDDWRAGLRRYLRAPAERRSDVEKGRRYVESRGMTQHAAAEWWRLFESLLEGTPLDADCARS